VVFGRFPELRDSSSVPAAPATGDNLVENTTLGDDPDLLPQIRKNRPLPRIGSAALPSYGAG
jgi:hypothetical protein